MNLQALVVAAIVIGCTGYAVWALLPVPGRRAVAGALLRLPLPAWMASPLHRAQAKAAAGCGGCGSCEAPAPNAGGNTGAKAPSAQPITFHPRRR